MFARDSYSSIISLILTKNQLQQESNYQTRILEVNAVSKCYMHSQIQEALLLAHILLYTQLYTEFIIGNIILSFKSCLTLLD